jgi:ribulose 1,5-bisphosphate synthetase/thiazole synthase
MLLDFRNEALTSITKVCSLRILASRQDSSAPRAHLNNATVFIADDGTAVILQHGINVQSNMFAAGISSNEITSLVNLGVSIT